MAIVVPGNFVFLANPHTASLATSDALASIPGAMRIGPHHATIEGLIAYGKVPNDPSVAPRDVLQGIEVKVATVRNPYDWLVTCWLRRRGSMGNPSFREYCEVLSEASPGAFVKGDSIQFHEADHQIHYETLEADLSAFLKQRGVGPVVVKQRNVTPDKKPWGEYYDADTYQVVNRRFGENFPRLGYEMR